MPVSPVARAAPTLLGPQGGVVLLTTGKGAAKGEEALELKVGRRAVVVETKEGSGWPPVFFFFFSWEFRQAGEREGGREIGGGGRGRSERETLQVSLSLSLARYHLSLSLSLSLVSLFFPHTNKTHPKTNTKNLTSLVRARVGPVDAVDDAAGGLGDQKHGLPGSRRRRRLRPVGLDQPQRVRSPGRGAPRSVRVCSRDHRGDLEVGDGVKDEARGRVGDEAGEGEGEREGERERGRERERRKERERERKSFSPRERARRR